MAAGQDDAGGPIDGTARPLVLAPVTVTARRFEEPLALVPFSLSLVDGAALQERGIRDTRDLYRSIPNFNFTDSGLPEANLLNIRGIGASSAFVGPSVTYYVDGVPLPARMFDQQFLDLRRIEVLRGPQGTLFGQNAQAGAVSMVTEDPTARPAFELGGEVGSYGERRLSATASGPVTARLGGRLAADLAHRDGDIRNLQYSGPNSLASDDRDIREQTIGKIGGKLRLLAGDATTATLSGRFQRDRQRPTTGVLLDGPGYPANALDPQPRNDMDSGGAVLDVQHDFAFARLTSLTGFQAYDLALETDITDGYIAAASSGLPVWAFANANAVRRIDERSSQWSQEFRLDGGGAGGFRWVGGVSALHADFASTTDITSPALPNGSYAAEIGTTNLAGFGEVTVPLLTGLRAVGGLRFTHERRDFDGRFTGRAGGAPAVPSFSEAGDVSSGFLTGRAGLSYDLAAGLTGYATIARGAKAGGYPFYNQAAAFGIAQQAYRGSATWSYEAGLRGTVAGGRLDLSSALFLNDTKDEQLFTFNPAAGQFQVQNADTRTYGGELEFALRPVESLTLRGDLALLQTAITRSDANSGLQDGNDLPYAPAFTASLGADYLLAARPLGLPGDFILGAEYQYVGSREIDPANSHRLSGYGLVNLRGGWQGDGADIYGYVRNLLDADYVQSGYRAGVSTTGSPVIGVVPGQPLSFGIGARLRF
ncbi:TonB-dependent receptor [Marinibaculum pumilum]|uniref:TonB-dependent receptor n=1 Tax=Marinibaculum pumilum TaxID=1766165 RepID=A0ABV7KZU6_9PROT